MPAASFRFLSTEAFDRLGSGEKLEYLSDAMEELERTKAPKNTRGWHSLFTQAQQQQQPQPNVDPDPPEQT